MKEDKSCDKWPKRGMASRFLFIVSLMLKVGCNKPSVTLASAAVFILIVSDMFMRLRSDFLWWLLSWSQIFLLVSGILRFTQFSSVRRFCDLSLILCNDELVCYFPSTFCAKASYFWLVFFHIVFIAVLGKMENCI